jgi:hypothetical protein
VVALARVGRRLHLAQQGVHFVAAHLPTGPDRAVTCHAGQHRLDPGLNKLTVAQIGQFIQHVADQGGRTDGAKDGGGLAHGNRAAAKGFDGQAKTMQIGGGVQNPRGIIRRQFNDFGDQQRLRGDARVGHLAFQPFIDQPFMRGMLIDDDDALRRLGDDVVFMHLRAGRPQWAVGGINAGCLDPGRRAFGKTGLRGLKGKRTRQCRV